MMKQTDISVDILSFAIFHQISDQSPRFSSAFIFLEVSRKNKALFTACNSNLLEALIHL